MSDGRRCCAAARLGHVSGMLASSAAMATLVSTAQASASVGITPPLHVGVRRRDPFRALQRRPAVDLRDHPGPGTRWRQPHRIFFEREFQFRISQEVQAVADVPRNDHPSGPIDSHHHGCHSTVRARRTSRVGTEAQHCPGGPSGRVLCDGSPPPDTGFRACRSRRWLRAPRSPGGGKPEVFAPRPPRRVFQWR